ncbi:MAG: CoA pyrophosphatase [Bacteroidota bacterium]
MNWDSIVQRLSTRLSEELPGKEAQREMASNLRDPYFPIPKDYRESAVLALLYPHLENKLHIVFMKRTQDGRAHGGQISFPGGRIEESDTDTVYTALREAEEELSVPSDKVKVLGTMTEMYIPVSNFMVYPVVGFLAERPDFIPQPDEVDEIIEIQLDTFFDDSIRQMYNVQVRPQLYLNAPSFKINGNVIWGATAMMMNELIHVLRAVPELTQIGIQAGRND